MHSKITAKVYVLLFKISIHTALKWIAQDRKRAGKKRLLFSDIAPIYGLSEQDAVEIGIN